jgi:hypothetical protein
MQVLRSGWARHHFLKNSETINERIALIINIEEIGK